MNTLPFSKMHGLGNCFVLMDDIAGNVSSAYEPAALARAICDRNFGIGADGLILVQTSERCDLKMRIFNEDGSEAEMCGNGIRCFAQFALDRGITKRRELSVETLAGPILTSCPGDALVRVDMGRPHFDGADVDTRDGTVPSAIALHGREYGFVSMGNPHAVTFVDDFDFDWRALGAQIETHPRFPNKTNVEFVQITGERRAAMKVWERGCGETMACGTGACAVAVAAAKADRLPRGPVTIDLPGGSLLIDWSDTDHVLMTGPAVLVCEGEYHPDSPVSR